LCGGLNEHEIDRVEGNHGMDALAGSQEAQERRSGARGAGRGRAGEAPPAPLRQPRYRIAEAATRDRAASRGTGSAVMAWLPLLNIVRTLRLERELAALSKQHEAMRADVAAYYAMTCRQMDPRSDPALLARVFRAENDLAVARLVMHHALNDMRAGRLD